MSTPVKTRLSAMMCACAQLKRTISLTTAVARKKKADVAGKLGPALVGVVEGLAEHEAEEVVPGLEAHPQHQRDKRIEQRDLDLHPHGVAGDQRERAEGYAHGAGDEWHHRRATEYQEAGDERQQRATDQCPGSGGDSIDAVHQEHRDQRPDLSQDVDGLLGIERIMPLPPGHCLHCHALSSRRSLVGEPPLPFPAPFLTQRDGARKLASIEGRQILDAFADSYSMHREAELC